MKQKTQKISDRDAYWKITEACRRQKDGATVADIVGRTSLSFATVKELIPKVADEYSARLQVTESGEILYSFPRGFKSKYRGFGIFMRNLAEKLGKGVKIVLSWLFKVWIMVMLIGYFALFMLLALAALVISMGGGSSENSNGRSSRGGGLYLAGSIFNLIMRIWFYSELTKSLDPYYYGSTRRRPKARPLHKAIFSFVFGDGNPNADWDSREKQAVIAYIQANKGVISLPEFIMLTGKKQLDAEEAITAYCAEFGGSPEATDDGTVVYQFDELLVRADTRDRSFGGSSPVKLLEPFSSNKAGMNTWFCIINGVNVIFGGYYLYNALTTGAVGIITSIARNGEKISRFVSQATGEAASYLYGITYALFTGISSNPLPVITVGLGVVPLVFSLLFWLIPALRAGVVKKRNEAVKIENLRKIAFARVWSSPRNIQTADIAANTPEAQPANLDTVQDRLIKEIGTYSQPEVSIGDTGAALYSFPELEREKRALQTYRAGVTAQDLGGTVFDTDSRQI
ncbi:MAG: hypothetical protein LBP19_10945 [Treponema sp.]|jgi:hypothetical protein|nr:hypothetical protein [Treponema sp.]